MLRHPHSKMLFEYWNRLRGKNVAPARSDFNPSAIPTALPAVVLLDAHDEYTTFRLAGTGFCAAHMRELRDFRFSSIWREQDQRKVNILAYEVARKGAGVAFHSEATTGKETVEFEMLLLPLLDLSGRLSLAVGTISHFGRPWSLGAHPLGDHTLKSMQVLFTGGETGTLPEPLATSVINFRGWPETAAPGRKVRHLRVIEGGLSSG